MIYAKEVLQAQLARGLGLDRYAEIMRGDPASPDFQRAFNGYYRIRRNEESKPIWDQYVLQNLGLELMGKTQEEKLQNAVALYAQIVNWYADYLTTDEARKNIDEFDRLLPEYAWVSDTKKIDCLLWCKR